MRTYVNASLPSFANVVVRGVGSNNQRSQVSRNHQRCEVRLRSGGAGGACEAGGDHRDEYPGRFRQRFEKAGRYAKHVEGRQPADGAFLRGWRSAGGHAGGEDPRFAGGRQPGRGRSGAGLRRVERNQAIRQWCIHRCRKRSGSIPSTRPATRPPSTLSIRSFPSRFRCILSSAVSELRRPAARRAVPRCRRSSAATWTLPKSAWAILYIFR